MYKAIVVATQIALILGGVAWGAIVWAAKRLPVLVGAPGHLDDADAWQREWLPVIAEMVTRADLWLRTNGYIVLIALGAASMLLTHGVPLLARYVKVKRNPALHIAWNNAFNRPDIKA